VARTSNEDVVVAKVVMNGSNPAQTIVQLEKSLTGAISREDIGSTRSLDDMVSWAEYDPESDNINQIVSNICS